MQNTSENVWFEEVNRGLLKELHSHVCVRNNEGQVTLMRRSAFVIRRPEEDFLKENIPCVSIYNKTYTFDKQRYNPTPVEVSIDKTNHVVTMEDSAIPYNLDYQLDFWSFYQEDMDIMTRTWLAGHSHQFNLPVLDDGSNQRTVSCRLTGQVTKSDLIRDGKRLFHTIMNYTIWVELDSKYQYNKPIVTDLVLEVEEENGGQSV